jgi:hypothetical protein
LCQKKTKNLTPHAHTRLHVPATGPHFYPPRRRQAHTSFPLGNASAGRPSVHRHPRARADGGRGGRRPVLLTPLLSVARRGRGTPPASAQRTAIPVVADGLPARILASPARGLDLLTWAASSIAICFAFSCPSSPSAPSLSAIPVVVDVDDGKASTVDRYMVCRLWFCASPAVSGQHAMVETGNASATANVFLVGVAATGLCVPMLWLLHELSDGGRGW